MTLYWHRVGNFLFALSIQESYRLWYFGVDHPTEKYTAGWVRKITDKAIPQVSNFAMKLAREIVDGKDQIVIKWAYTDDKTDYINTKPADPNQILSNFPEIINCHVGSTIIYLYFLRKWSSNTIEYRFLKGTYDAVIQFNSNGSYKTYTGTNEETSLGCVDKNIKQLYEEGRAWNIIKSKTKADSQTDSIANGKPDVIMCTNTGANEKYLLWSHRITTTMLSYYM